MEINLKINFPSNSNPEKQENQTKIPKALKITYYLDFGDMNNEIDSNKNSQGIILDSKNVGNDLKASDLNNPINLNLKNLQGNKLEIIDKNSKSDDKIINISKDNEEKDKHPSFKNNINNNKNINNNNITDININNNNNNVENKENDVWESDNNKIRKETFNKNNNNKQGSRGHSLLSNIHSKRSNDNRSNKFGSYGRDKVSGGTNNYNDKQNTKNDIPHDANTELFVTGIRDYMDENNIIETFKKYGDIENVKLLKDKVTKKNKGVGFVRFFKIASAMAAMLDADNIKCKGKNLKISYNKKYRRKKGYKDNVDKNYDNDNFNSFQSYSNISDSVLNKDKKKSNNNSNKSGQDDNVSHYSNHKRDRSREDNKEDDW